MNILGMTFARHIGIEDSEQLLRAIRITDPDAHRHRSAHPGRPRTGHRTDRPRHQEPGKVTVFVPHYAMSGGT